MGVAPHAARRGGDGRPASHLLNFVSSSRERIEQEKLDWREGRFAPVPGETERIPLPSTGPAMVRYP